jgi:hypothetical protein
MIESMEDYAAFCRQRADACFHRRRKYPVLSENWRHEVSDARQFQGMAGQAGA